MPAADIPAEFQGATPVGDFLVLRSPPGLLGRGSFSETYRAWQTSLSREVAFKLFTGPFGAATDADTLARVRERELPSMVRLAGHPGIASPIDAGELPDGTPWIAMELIRGRSLRALLREHTLFPIREAIRIAVDLCDALAAAHAVGVWHRDIKPENIILADDGPRAGRPVLIDWGTAKIRDHAARLVTDESHALGTRAYMAPERLVVGAPDDHRADLYSLGAVLHEMLTGLVPGDHETALPVAELRHGEARDEIDTILRRALDPHPDQRHPDASALRADLERYLAAAPSAPRRGWWAAAAGLAVLAAFSAALWWPEPEAPRPQPRPVAQPAPPPAPAFAWFALLRPRLEAAALPARVERAVFESLAGPVAWRLRDGSEVSGSVRIDGDRAILDGARAVRFPHDVEPASLMAPSPELTVWLYSRSDIDGAARAAIAAGADPMWRPALRRAFLDASAGLDDIPRLALFVDALDAIADGAADAPVEDRRMELAAWRLYETGDAASLLHRHPVRRATARLALELVAAVEHPQARTLVPGLAPGEFSFRATQPGGAIAADGDILSVRHADSTAAIVPRDARPPAVGQFLRFVASGSVRLFVTREAVIEVRGGEAAIVHGPTGGILSRGPLEPQDDVYDIRVAYAHGSAVVVANGALFAVVEGGPPEPCVQVEAGELRILEWVIRGDQP